MTKPSERYLVMQNLSAHYQKLKDIQPATKIKEQEFRIIEKKGTGEKERMSMEREKNNYYLWRNLLSISLRNDTTFDRGEKEKGEGEKRKRKGKGERRRRGGEKQKNESK